ncbi:hypothetical protein ACFCXR_40175 [Streptomyces noursei]|uniref:hypothetical protein n=1 Tax=Streptomyces noursei TaxID=1971 RepID=UPI0035D65855
MAALFAVNSLFCVLMQTRIGSRIETPHDGNLAFRTAGLLFLVSCPMMALAAYTPVWAAGLVLTAIFVHSLGEVWESSAAFALGFGLAPDHAQGQYQGVFGLGFSAGQALAPRSSPRRCSASARQMAAAGGVLRGTGRCRSISCPLGHADPAATRRCSRSDRMTAS